MLDNIDIHGLMNRAQKALKANDLGDSTKPAPALYPHQWNWDSAFIAIGLSHFDQIRAQLEIKSLLKAQWRNGLLPHIVFNPDAPDYHPGPSYWHTEIPESPQNILTSGITQPPILAYAALQVYKNAKDKDNALQFLRDTYPPLITQSEFLFQQRSPDDDGLAFICHPWESGMDNSPCWDLPLENFTMDFEADFMRKDNSIIPANQRPSDDEYSRYSYLVQRYSMTGWDQQQIFDLKLFQVQSILFNVLHHKALHALSEIAGLIGEAPDCINQRVRQVEAGFETKLWDASSERYLNLDLKTGQHINTDNINQFLPLFTVIPSPERAEALIARLNSTDFWSHPGWGISTQAHSSEVYDNQCYWRGPVWINMNWMIIKGLENYGYSNLAHRLAHETLKLVALNGFFEYFNPETGQGLGSDSFSWTAALVLDLIAAGYE